MGQNLWWGYRHENGGFQVKKYFGDPQDLLEAKQSDFVNYVVQPFVVPDAEPNQRAYALKEVQRKCKNK